MKYVLILLTTIVTLIIILLKDGEPQCPTRETFVQDFNNWSIGFLDGHPEYAEKEQREGWQQHLEELGCAESQRIINDAVCIDCK